MSDAGKKLRRAEGRYMHWCSGCQITHPLPDSWTFNGDLERPTFSPSFKQMIGDVTCHYFITNGDIVYCADSWHGLAGKTVPLPVFGEEANA